MTTEPDHQPDPEKARAPLDLSYSEIALELHGADSPDEMVQRILDSTRTALGGDDAGVLLVHSRRRVETAAATSGPVARAHELQVELDEGPCLDAIESDAGIYRIDDTMSDARWPTWAARVAEIGFRSVLSAPLATRQRRYGSINVYARRPGAFDIEDEPGAMILARHASVALASSDHIEGLRRAVDGRRLIGIAIGLLMERYDLDSQRAFEVLRRYSQDHNVKLRDVAQRVVTERELPQA